MNTLEQKARPNAQNSMAHTEDTTTTSPSQPVRLGRWFLLVVVIIGAGLAIGVIPRLRARDQLREDTRELSIPTVSVTHAAPGKAAPDLILPAEVKPYVEAPIYARANGYLKKWYVDIGVHVQAGQLLAEIDTPEINQELATAKAVLTRDEAALDLAKITANRWAELLKTASVSEQEAAEKKSDLALKTATVEADHASVHRLEDLQSFSRVTAPFDGTITSRNVDTGDLISAGNGRELFRLAETGKLRIYVHVPQTAAQTMTTGATAELILPENPGHHIPAKLVRTSGEIDASSRTLLTELEVDNSQGQILAGSYAQVSFAELKQQMPLVLSSSTLLFQSDGMQVGVVNSNNQVELRKISLGRDLGRSVEVLDGITANDRVIMNPSDTLTAGITVRVAEAPEAETKAETAKK